MPFKLSSQGQAKMRMAATQRYYRRLGSILRKHLPDHVASLSEQQLFNRIACGHQIAQEHEVVTERAVGKWMAIDLICGAQFYKSNEFRKFWTQSTLEPKFKVGLSPEQKLDILFNGLKNRLPKE